MLVSNVRWVGLTPMIMDLQGRSRAMMPMTNTMTKGILNAILGRYQVNLSGSQPSTDMQPLPVGVRTGQLLAGATKRQVNQYKGSVFNDVEWSGWIESGTRYMSPRRPLGDAVDRVGRMVPGEMNEVVRKVWRG